MNENDKNQIIELIKAGEKLPKEFIYKHFADEEDVFLFWNGRKEDVTNVALPFHSIEHIDEPRKEEKKQGDMFEMFDTRGRQLKGWTNKLIWGDNNKKAGKYKVMVKVVDILGIDTSKILEVSIT